jgi:hypothetical protein
MRINEILDEGKKLRKSAQHSLPHGETLSADPYTAYRLMVSVAGSPTGPTMTKRGPSPGYTVLPYTDAEQEMLNNAKKKMGISSRKITKGSKSEEMPNTNTVSPMTPKGPVKRKNK